MKFAYLTDVGLVRDINEDGVKIIEKDGEILMLVCDGMGGHKAGDIASEIAIKSITTLFENSNLKSVEEAKEWFNTGISLVNDKIRDFGEKDDKYKGMGTTLVFAYLNEEFGLIGNVGDSRAYVLEGSKIKQATEDHTFVNLLLKGGNITKEEAKNHPRKNVLMQAIGVHEINVEFFEIDMKKTKEILLCSDGLSNLVDQNTIKKTMLKYAEVEVVCEVLIEKAKKSGGTDNISVAYLRR